MGQRRERLDNRMDKQKATRKKKGKLKAAERLRRAVRVEATAARRAAKASA